MSGGAESPGDFGESSVRTGRRITILSKAGESSP